MGEMIFDRSLGNAEPVRDLRHRVMRVDQTQTFGLPLGQPLDPLVHLHGRPPNLILV